MTESHIFSTGILRIGAPGTGALAQDGSTTIGVIQDVTLDTTYSRHDLFDAAVNSVFAVDTADHEGKFKLKFTTKDISRKLLAYTTGAAHTVNAAAAGPPAVPAQDVYAIGGKSVPQFCRLEYDGVDTSGKNVHIVIPTGKPTGQSIASKVTDFADTPIEVDAYGLPSNNYLVATVSIDQ